MGIGPERVRSEAYLKSVRGLPCLYCGQPGEAHHLQFAQPRAMALKTGDQWVVPLCHKHHMELHNSGMPERTWWALLGILPLEWAEQNYKKWNEEK